MNPRTVFSGTNQFRAIIFDLYGTLLIYGDMATAWSQWFTLMEKALYKLGATVDPLVMRSHCDGMFARSLQTKSGYTVYESRIADLAERCGVSPNGEWCRELAQTSLDCWQQYISPDPTVTQVLGELCKRGIKLGLLSNFDHPPHVHKLLLEYGWQDFFKAKIISGEVALKKPNSEIFSLALTQLQVESQECIMVGDHPLEDVQGAMDAGLSALLLERSGGIDRLHTDFRADLQAGKTPQNASKNFAVASNLCQLLDMGGLP